MTQIREKTDHRIGRAKTRGVKNLPLVVWKDYQRRHGRVELEDMEAIEQGQDPIKPEQKDPSYPLYTGSYNLTFTQLDFEVARLRPEDRDHVVDIIKEILTPFQEAGSVLASAFRRLRNFDRIYDNHAAAFLCLYHRETQEIIGGAGLGPFAGLNPEDRIGEIRELFVRPSYRNLGLGRKLLEACLSSAKTMNYQRIYLETTPEMINAQRLFKSFGFLPVIEKKKNGEPRRPRTSLPCYFVLNQLA